MITVIGDVHGDTAQYKRIVAQHLNTVQVGDFGFAAEWNELKGVDSTHHKVLGGNHDDYNVAPTYAHYLGDFGMHTLNGISFFFLRGGLSLDRQHRMLGVNYFHKEELSHLQMEQALQSYEKHKPDIVISHCPPETVHDHVFGKNDTGVCRFGYPAGFREKTAKLGQQMLETHRPKLWISGHLHKDVDFCQDKTRFIVLLPLQVYTFSF